MDYKGVKCPVCGLEFEDSDDVVVCPDCGTPHHRECYEIEGHCANVSKHTEGFEWKKDSKSKADDEDKPYVVCMACRSKNDPELLFCRVCGHPLERAYRERNTGFGPGSSSFPGFPFDPMLATKPEQNFDENVTRDDLTAVVKVNTFYYLNIFTRIKRLNLSKFNFPAFFFSGAWMLYRKMYGLGAFFTAVYFAATLISLFFLPQSLEIQSALLAKLGSRYSYNELYQAVLGLSVEQMIVYIIPTIMQFVKFVFMIIAGVMGNRMYYKRCKQKVKKVKAEEKDEKKATVILSELGGINNKVPIVIAICYFVLNAAKLYIQFM